jgi:hypothetical protein
VICASVQSRPHERLGGPTRTVSRQGQILLASIVALTALAAQGDTTFTTSSGSTLRLDGTTTLHRWRCANTQVVGVIRVPLDIEALNAFFDRVQKETVSSVGLADAFGAQTPPATTAEIRATITAIGCGSRAMENDLQSAMKASKYPVIVYTFERLRGISLPTGKDCPGTVVLHTEGLLGLAGEERNVTVDVRVSRAAHGGFKLQADCRFKMSEFGIVPPKTLYGLVKAGDSVDARFALRLETTRADEH